MPLFDAAGFVYERKLQEVVFEIQRRYFAHKAALWKERAGASLLEFAKTAEQTIEMEVWNGFSAKLELLRARKNVLDAQYEREAARALVRNTLGKNFAWRSASRPTPASHLPQMTYRRARGICKPVWTNSSKPLWHHAPISPPVRRMSERARRQATVRRRIFSRGETGGELRLLGIPV